MAPVLGTPSPPAGIDIESLFESEPAARPAPEPGDPWPEQAESSIRIDDGYAAEVESVRPGGIVTEVGIDVAVDEPIRPPGVPPMPPPPPPARPRGMPPPPPPPKGPPPPPARNDPFGLEALLPPDPSAGRGAFDALAPLDFEEPARPSSRPPAPAGVLQLQTGAAPPLLMDVTPHSLGLLTVGGFCQHVIRKNAPIPAEQTRLFTTAHDGQESVRTRICQGESRTFEENQLLGEIELTGLRKAERGQVRIEVSFIIDANGTLDVTAKDLDTGRAQRIRINLLGGLGEAEIRDMIERQAAFG
jgi:molecular chaperone DnaK